MTDYTSGSSAKSINHRKRGVDIPRLSRDLDALHSRAKTCRNLLRNLDTLCRGCGLPIGSPHAVHQRIRYVNAGDFVGHEFRVTCAFERENAGNHRNMRMLDALQEALEIGEVEDRPGQHKLGARLDFVIEAPKFLVEIGGGRVDGNADVKAGRCTDRLATVPVTPL